MTKPSTFLKLGFYPIARIILGCSLVIGIMDARSQTAANSLEKKITAIVTALKTASKTSEKESAGLGIMQQLKIAIEDVNPDAVATIERTLKLQYDGKHRSEMLAVIRLSSTEVGKIKLKQQQQWRIEVSEFLKAVERDILNEASIADLEKLDLKGNEITKKQPKGKSASSVWMRSELSKLTSASKLLDKWIEIRRHEDSGYYSKAANSMGLLMNPGSSSGYPILDSIFLIKRMGKVKRMQSGKRMSAVQKPENSIESKIRITLEKLDDEKFESKNIISAADQLVEALNGSPQDKVKDEQIRIAGSLQELGDSLYYLESKDSLRARTLLTDFVSTASKIDALKRIRVQAASEMIPVLYSQIGALPPKPNESITRYLTSLASSAEDETSIALKNELMQFYGHYFESKLKPIWVDPASSQYSALARATLAMKCQDYSLALKHYRHALSYAPNSGPANSEKLISAQIEHIKNLEPALFDPTTAETQEKLEVLEKRVKYLKFLWDKRLREKTEK